MSDIAQDLTAARTRRLLPIVEIMEACRELDEPVDVATLTDVVLEGYAALGAECERARPADDAEIAALCVLTVLLGALADVMQVLADYQRPGRLRRRIQELRESLTADVVAPRMQLLSQEQQTEIMVAHSRWGYSIWGPWHQQLLLDILERASKGAYMPVKLQKQAGQLLEHLRVALPAAKEPQVKEVAT